MSRAFRDVGERDHQSVKRRGLKQAEAGKIPGIQQPHISALMRNRAATFSVERLMDFLKDETRAPAKSLSRQDV
jgi:predicted XRE-type DNA-binding protein